MTAFATAILSASGAPERDPAWTEAARIVASYEEGQSRAGLIGVENRIRDALADAARLEEAERWLVAILESDGTADGKRFVCRQLAIAGSGICVPALAARLRDGTLADMARFALEAIPDPAADSALLSALDGTTGPNKIGAIMSLGARRVEAATGPLERLVSGPDEAVARAAATAIARIGTVAALAALRGAYPRAAASVQPQVADCTMAVAHAALARGQRQPAEEAFLAFHTPSQSAAVRAMALRGLLAVDVARHVPLLIGILCAREDAVQGPAAALLRDQPGGAWMPRVLDAFPRMAPRVQALVLKALADRGDPAVLPAARACMAGADSARAAAAYEAVGALGGEEDVRALVEGLENADRTAAARTALVRLRGPGVDEAMVGSIGRCDAPAQKEMVRILVERKAVAAVPALLQIAGSPASGAHDAAFQALGALAGEADLPALATLAVQPRQPSVRGTAERALLAAATRVDDPRRWARAIMDGYPKADAAGRCVLLRVLRFSGDAQALTLVRRELAATDEAVSDAAIRAMADWPNADPVDDLVRVLRSGAGGPRQLLVSRGVVRMAGQVASTSAEAGLALLKDVMDAAGRAEERWMVLGALMTVPHVDALHMARASLEDPAVENEAGVAVLGLAEALRTRHPEAAREAVGRVLSVTTNETLKKQARALFGKLGPPAR